jgi:glycosyltransferase involved in cell wall biosynthesis
MTPGSAKYEVVFYQPWISALYAPAVDLPVGGAEAQIHLLAQELARRGRRVAIVANSLPGLPEAVGGVDILQRPANQGGRVRAATRRLASFRMLTGLSTEVIVKRVAGFDTALVALAAKLGRRRFVYSSAHVVDFKLSQLEPRHRAALHQLGLRMADTIVVQTHEQEEICRRALGRRPIVIKSIVEPAPERSEVPASFLWVGRLVHYKQPLAFVELARAAPDLRFEMVGVAAAGYDQTLHARILEAERELDNLTLLPPQPRDELGRRIDAAVAVVNTSESEGMSNVLLEAWSRGVPALALAHDPDGVIEREGLGWFADGSLDELASLAQRAWDARTDQTAVAERCRDYVAREHSPASVGDRWVDALGLSGAR